MEITPAQFKAACEAAARSEFESASKWESYARATRAALTVIGVTVKESA